jgi:hypothetical protein
VDGTPQDPDCLRNNVLYEALKAASEQLTEEEFRRQLAIKITIREPVELENMCRPFHSKTDIAAVFSNDTGDGIQLNSGDRLGRKELLEDVDCRSGSLTRCHIGVVQRVPVGDGAANRSRRSLNRRCASMHTLVDESKHAPVSGVVLQGEDASLDDRRSDTGEGYAVTAEPILSGERVP